jgi:CBS domain containing-hemolysin-like protein
VGDRRLRVDGSLLLHELNQHFDINYDEEEVDTVGGLIMAHLGRIPEVGDVVELNGVRYEVEQVTGRAVDSVLVELPAYVQIPAEVTEDDTTSATGPD